VRTRLTALLHPKDIILFGSYAKGTATPDSDVDLFIIMPQGVEPARTMVVEARRAIKDVLYAQDLAFGVLVKSFDSFERYKRFPGTIQHEVATHGVSLLA
jgi:predicted nucleotidyltransferase